jgi:anti-anti-sigma factor
VERSSGAAPPRRPGGSGRDEDDGEILSVRVDAADAGAAVISLAGELDLSTIRNLEPRLLEEVRNPVGVVVDLTRLSFIDSSGIGLLIKAFRSLDERPGGMYTVVAPGSQVERVFQLAGIDRALRVFTTRDHALSALDGNSRRT